MKSEKLKDKSLIKGLIKYFLQGLFYTVPVAVTIFIIFYLVVQLDSIVPFEIPGLGILIIIAAVTFIGFIGTHFFFNYLKPFERLIENTPLIKIIYSSMKDMMNAFVGKKKQFKQPVLVQLGSMNAERIGFVTKNDLEELGISKDKVAVYLPFSYAISGEVLIVPKDMVTPLDASSTEVMRFIISGGVTSVEKQKPKTKNHEKIT